MLRYLQEPYPFRRDFKTDLLYILGTGAFVALFLIVFQPNDTDDFRHPYKYPFLAGYGLVIIVIMLFFRFVIPLFWKSFFREEKWTVGRQILWLLVTVYAAIVGCFLYYSWFFENDFFFKDLWGFSMISFTIAVFPLSAYVLIDYIRKLKRYQQGAERFNQQDHRSRITQSNSPERIQLTDENGKVQLKLNPDQLWYFQSSMNYVEVIYSEEDEFRREIIRNSLKNLENELPKPLFLRTHRSYIVNTQKVQQLSGNAQGYKLHLIDELEPVPVSRSKSKEVLELLD